MQELQKYGEALGAAAGALARVLEGEAAGQDVAGNGHVASAEESTAAGSSRGAPPAPVSSAPAPSSPAAPRRWWLRRRSDAGWPDAHAYTSLAGAEAMQYGPQGDGWPELVPVIEATAYDAACREREDAQSVRAYWEHAFRLSESDVETLRARLAIAERERDEALIGAQDSVARAQDADSKMRQAWKARDKARAALRQFEEAEARCCPEDVGFEERIATLTRERDKAWQERAEALGKLDAAEQHITILTAARAPRRVTREEVARAALALDGPWITDDGMTRVVRVVRALGLEVDDA